MPADMVVMRFVLRIEETDAQRSQEGLLEAAGSFDPAHLQRASAHFDATQAA